MSDFWGKAWSRRRILHLLWFCWSLSILLFGLVLLFHGYLFESMLAFPPAIIGIWNVSRLQEEQLKQLLKNEE